MRKPELIEHSLRTLIGQRVFGMALEYEDLNDHESLRHDTVFGALLGKLEPKRRRDCARRKLVVGAKMPSVVGQRA